ncbi:acyltransferase family protein [Acinetobacter pseudolwoffii]|uniref:Acyltransferase n=1 Tax=Acinetobacter pseudolwoffii TaxID=2053287 RepID=A0A2H9ULI8_9GAMM|nr:acyltransferase family protein [Acinetobacter pseudolwoffii]PJI32569.1 acyltransferase [Acinetobacter pseudolwoffii]
MQKFRYDINGLRAYAVALVVLYHFDIIGFNAGFIGVDIFFVISGYLMTSIIYKGLSVNSFSYINFYLARAVRILPALVVMCVCLAVVFWFILLPQEYRAFGKHSIFSINFLSNIIYWKESGYFDIDSHNKSLLHTWSLSVEWQFYLIYPLIMAIIYKFSSNRKFIFYILSLIGLLSLYMAISIEDQSAGFFLIHTRAWEMIAGGLVFLIALDTNRFSKFFELIGFFFIFLSCFIFDTSTPWPSYNALLPVIGTVLILIANRSDSLLTNQKIFQWIGNTSYSIYLWHWPIVFLLFYFYKDQDLLFKILGVILSLFFGYVSYHYIENISRKKLSSIKELHLCIIWGVCILILSVACYSIYISNGYPKRWSEIIQHYHEVATTKNSKAEKCVTDIHSDSVKSCTYGEGEIKLLVIGDSHSNALLNGVIKSLPQNSSLVHWWVPNCATVLGLKRKDDSNYNCGNLVEQILVETDKYPNVPVLIINRSNALFLGQPENESHTSPVRYVNTPHNHYDKAYINEMRQAYFDTFKLFREKHPVFITTPLPEAEVNIPNYMSKLEAYGVGDKNKLRISKEEYLLRSRYSFDFINTIQQELDVKVIDIHKMVCDENFCYFYQNHNPLYMDDDHFGWKQSEIFSHLFSENIFYK